MRGMRRLVPALLTLITLAAVALPGVASGAGFSLGEPFVLPAGTNVEALAVGDDGDLWFGGSVGGARPGNVLGRISADGKVDEFPVPESAATPGIGGLAPGPDGNMWFTWPAADRVGWMSTTGVTGGFQSPVTGARPTGIVAAPSGAIWVTMEGTGGIARLGTTNAVTEFPLPPGWRPTQIALGPESSLWAIDGAAPDLARQPQEGRALLFSVPTEGKSAFAAGASFSDIVAGPDGNLWLAQSDGPYVASVKAIGGQTEYVRYDLSIGGGTSFVANGPGKDIYFAGGPKIGSISTRGGHPRGESLCAVQGCPRVTALTQGVGGRLWFAAGRYVGEFRPPDIRPLLPKGLGRPRGKKVSVEIECRGGIAGEACTGTLSLQLADQPKKAISGRPGFHVATTRRATVKVPLSAAGAASLAAEGKLRVRLVARLGAKVAAIRNYTLRTGG
jgi:streptogramin lyase